ncbi:Minichromosome loss protein Mcl1 [Babesia duncani]|nr:Minichromosome loss protein Mcl1 [Babesia duncani]
MSGDELMEEAKSELPQSHKTRRLKRHITELDDYHIRKMVDQEAVDEDNEEQDEEYKDEETYRDILDSYDNLDKDEMTHFDQSRVHVMHEISKLRKKVASLDNRVAERTTLVPGSCPAPDDAAVQWVLFWDEVGQITKQLISDVWCLHVHVFSGPLAGYKRKPDRYNCHTAALNQKYVVTGSEINVDGGHVHGILTFLDFENNTQWDRRFFNEYISAVAVGDSFVAAITADGILYILSLARSLMGVFQLKGSPIAIAARGNVLATITEATTLTNVSSFGHVRMFWVNGLRGLAKNPASRIVDLYSDSLVLGPDKAISWISFSSQCTLWITDTSGQLMALLPAIESCYKVGGYSLEWIPFMNLENLVNESSDYEPSHTVFPLYVSDMKPLNFMGYTLKKACLRIDGCVGAYLPFQKFNGLVTKDPQLREVIGSDIISDVASIPWQQYDEMRHIQSLQACQNEYILKVFQNYNFWMQNSQGISDDAISAFGNAERVHDKWTLRILRKTKDSKQDSGVLLDALWMLRFPKCLEAAFSILQNQLDAKQRQVLQEASLLLENVTPFENNVQPLDAQSQPTATVSIPKQDLDPIPKKHAPLIQGPSNRLQEFVPLGNEPEESGPLFKNILE